MLYSHGFRLASEFLRITRIIKGVLFGGFTPQPTIHIRFEPRKQFEIEVCSCMQATNSYFDLLSGSALGYNFLLILAFTLMTPVRHHFRAAELSRTVSYPIYILSGGTPDLAAVQLTHQHSADSIRKTRLQKKSLLAEEKSLACTFPSKLCKEFHQRRPRFDMTMMCLDLLFI